VAESDFESWSLVMHEEAVQDPTGDQSDASSASTEHSAPLIEADPVAAAALVRRSLVEKAVETWVAQLIDLSGNNRLLYYRDLKRGTLNLGASSEDRLGDLLAGKKVRLTALITDPTVLGDALLSCRRIRAKAKENFEEWGIPTLYLACGFASWNVAQGGAVPRAPVLIAPLAIDGHGAKQEEFDLTLTGDFIVNPTLLHFFAKEHRCAIDGESVWTQPGIEGEIDTLAEVNTALSWFEGSASGVRGVSVLPGFVVGNFSYEKMPMVDDLESSIDALVEHDLISALSGYQPAQAAVRALSNADVSIAAPDSTPPQDEFVVLDADSSQNHAINKALAGANLIIQGPPGTGKSQTIANLTAASVAHGRKVLFVAEKRAAIEAVLKRLGEVGLDDLVLDLHRSALKKREVAESFARSLSRIDQRGATSIPEVGDDLATIRSQLNDATHRLHASREPWRISAFDANVGTFAASADEQVAFRLSGQSLAGFLPDVLKRAHEVLKGYGGIGSLGLRKAGSPWVDSVVTSAAEVDEARLLVSSLLGGEIESAFGVLVAAASDSGVEPATSWSEWRAYLEAWESAAIVNQSFRASIYAVKFETLIPALAPLASGLLSRAVAFVTDGEYRKALTTIKAERHSEAKVPPARLLELVSTARGVAAYWQGHGRAGVSVAVPDGLEIIAQAYRGVDRKLNRIAQLAGLAEFDGTSDHICEVLRSMQADDTVLAKTPERRRLHGELASLGLEGFIEEVESVGLELEQAECALDFIWHRSIVEELMRTVPEFAAFDGSLMSRVVMDFQRADSGHIGTADDRVRALAAAQARAALDAFPDQEAVIRHQAKLQRRHKPVASLFAENHEVMLGIKPCWVMSPLIVSRMLPSDKPYFDLVIFDEASQVMPADAIPAIARGKQLVVAGDSNQLPPTNFFTRSVVDDEPGDDEEFEDAGIAMGAGFESILDALDPFLGAGATLKWHYRSQDERLINFSNVHFYDRLMTTFPGSDVDDVVRHVLVEYDKNRDPTGASRSEEVNRVVNLIIEHFDNRPDESLGVVGFGSKHAERIADLLRLTRVARPDLDSFFSETRSERLFIKNLETVQGDERDAIILSTGYGARNADGTLAHRFGPIANSGGERRLNVAITRARKRITLVSTFDHRDIDPDRVSNIGPKLLRDYIQYASSGGIDLGEAARYKPELNPFEIDVRNRLVAAGLVLSPQHGSGGYLIDFAVKNPARPGSYVLAIECDGASYHSAPIARERDRLRQEHLERLGWRFHRIWSQDWFRDPATEAAKAVAAALAAINDANSEGSS